MLSACTVNGFYDLALLDLSANPTMGLLFAVSLSTAEKDPWCPVLPAIDAQMNTLSPTLPSR